MSKDCLYIRADMNTEIASGHIMRCLSVADAASTIGISAVFILADNNAKEYVENFGYETIVLDTDWRNLESELPMMHELIKKRGIRHLLIDSYKVTQNYLNSLNLATEVTYLDDLNAFVYPVSKVIYYDCCVSQEEYIRCYVNTKVFYGYDYVPLRSEFSDNCREKRLDNINNILVLSGGADEFHAIKRIVAAIKDEEVNITAICGRLNDDYEELLARYKDSNVTVLKSVNNIADYMKKSDLCITAAGNTVYESAASLTPMITYILSKEQYPVARKLSDEDIAVYLGNMKEDTPENRLRNLLLELKANPERLKNMADKGKTLVDGNGAWRIAKAVFE